MSRKRIAILIMIGIAVVLVAAAMILPAVLGGEEPVMEAMEKLPERDIPAQIYLWLDKGRDSEGYGAFYSDGFIYLAARMGRRPTGGYAVLLGDVKMNSQVVVKVQHKAPRPWDMVTQVITYPHIVAKLACPGEPPETALFFSQGNTVIAKTAIVNLDAETGE